MKLLFCHPSNSLLQRLLDRPLAGHHLVVPCHQAAELIPTAAATEPHLIVIGDENKGTSLEELRKNLRRAGLSIPVLILRTSQPGDRQLDGIWHRLQISNRKICRPRFDAQSHTVLTESSFEPRGSEPVVTPKDLAAQENRLLALLASGAQCHQRAKAYSKAAAATEHQFASDWALATLAGEARVCLWRTQLFRHVSLLAHYIPGVDVDNLPMPHPPSSKMDYLSNALSGEALYALCALRVFGIDPECESALWKLGQIHTSQPTRCAEEWMRISGWAGLMRQIASAHDHVLDFCLGHKSGRGIVTHETYVMRCEQQLFCRWWNFSGFLNSLELLNRVSGEFHAGRRAVGIPPYDSFFEFADQIQQGVQAQVNRN